MQLLNLPKSPDDCFLFANDPARLSTSPYTVESNHINYQGTNARKVISEVYASFVLQCTVSGWYCKHKTDDTA